MHVLRRRSIALLLTALALVGMVASRPSSQVFLGDRIQVVLPVVGGACALWRGGLAEYVGRYAGATMVVHGLKRGLGDAEINRRPNGKSRGFPSGHAAASVYGASYLVRECGALLPYAGPAAVLAAGFVGGSRIDAGRHDLFQVMAGALIALFFDLSFRRAASRRAFAAGVRGGFGLMRGGVAVLRRSAVRRALPLLLLAPALPFAPARAESSFSVYSGLQGAAHSDVSGRGADRARLDFRAGWEGKSFDGAPYYGLRATRWIDPVWGIALDFSHSKLAADDATLSRSGFDRLEFTDGLNIATINVLRRFPRADRVTPYAGLGLGIVYPHVEITDPDAPERTFEYQYGGPALQALAGLSYRLAGRWSVFGEYKGSYVALDVDYSGGGRLEADVFVNAVNLGITYDF